MALSLADRGLDVILTYNTYKEGAEQAVSQIKSKGRKAEYLQLDISKINSLGSFVENVLSVLKSNWKSDKFDFLINNAGVGLTLPIQQATEEAFDNMMNIHYKGVYFLTQKFLPHINDNGGIIFISTGTTRFCVPGYSIYASLKGAVEVLSKYFAKEFGQRGIRSNVVAPGAIETDFNNAAIRNNPQLKSYLASQTALGRVGNADDIGGVVAFLCTEEAKWINAQRIEASGGMFL
jgi:NAD(P)-dependent dehydrogenase (short-subunit alcohol dehydrogenase family)